VLEAYTDVTRYPRPKRTDCAIIVAATDDAYVSKESVRVLAGICPASLPPSPPFCFEPSLSEGAGLGGAQDSARGETGLRKGRHTRMVQS